MAKLQFIKGAITGKLGEFVGAKWKGINYIRTYTKPANPKTAAQMSIRQVFSELSAFASALYAIGFHNLIPRARRMTERNSVFRANAVMLTNRAFVPSALQIAKPNLPATITIPTQSYTASGISLSAVIQLGDGLAGDGYNLHVVAYNPDTRKLIGHGVTQVSFPSGGALTTTATAELSQTPAPTACRFLTFLTREGANGERLMSAAANTPA